MNGLRDGQKCQRSCPHQQETQKWARMMVMCGLLIICTLSGAAWRQPIQRSTDGERQLTIGTSPEQTVTLYPDATEQEKADCYSKGGHFVGPHLCAWEVVNPSPAFQAQLDHIEQMLKAICYAHSVRSGALIGTLSGCPEEKP